MQNSMLTLTGDALNSRYAKAQSLCGAARLKNRFPVSKNQRFPVRKNQPGVDSMKSKKLLLTSSICAAIAGVSGIANAGIPAVPGEALLVPLALTSGATDGIGTDTYIGLRVPITLGTDTVLNTYTAPHTTTADVVTVQTLDDPRIYWVMFDERSVKVTDGTCDVSPGDMTLWTTDVSVRNVQQRQQAGILSAGIQGIPSPVCGPTNTIRPRFGYVVFQTISGADGQVADFAFTGEAMVRSSIYAATISVPVLPMADGQDPLPEGSGIPQWMNEVITSTGYGDGRPQVPVRYAPIVAGIRMNDADATPEEDVVTQMPIAGPAGGSGLSLHVHWFDRNDAARVSYNDIYDDMEGQCSEPWPLPNELNLTMYNQSIAPVGAGAFPTASWNNVADVANGFNTDGSKVNVIQAVEPAFGQGIGAVPYCAPDYWLENSIGSTTYPGALVGYVEGRLPETNVPPPAPGLVNSAAVQFSAVEDVQGNGWSVHLASDLGKQ